MKGTIRDNLAMGRDIKDELLFEAARTCEIHDHILSLPKAYDAYLGSHGAMLSSGQKQRLSLVRGILQDPDILILDEATSHLDLVTEAKILERVLHAREGRLTIIISHRPSVLKLASTTYVIEKGLLREQAQSVYGI